MTNDELNFRSLSSYIEATRITTGLSIDPVSVMLPIGPAADRYLWDAMCLCCSDEKKVISFTAPCIRREKRENILNGSHLSLFFLLFLVFGEKVEDGIIDNKYRCITSVDGISVKEILSHKEKNFWYGGFDYRQKFVPSAKNFLCDGYAYEMFDEQGIEICNIAEFTMKENAKHCYVFAFGIERMIMHLEGKSDIWRTQPFKNLFLDEKDNVIRDKKRRTFYQKALASQSCVSLDCLLI